MWGRTSIVALVVAQFAWGATPLQRETISVASLGAPSPHCLIINDPNFFGYMDSRIVLMDADTGTVLGQLSTGGYRGSVEIGPGMRTLYSPETYYERVTRGRRSEVVTVYETENLTALGEVEIPPKRATGAMHRGYNGLSDDSRFMFVANMTPAMSVSVVDVTERSFAGEIVTSGCMIILPTGVRSFAMLCGDGGALDVRIDDAGKLVDMRRTAPFFDAMDDPVTEKAARIGSTWYLVSFGGRIHPLDKAADGTLAARPAWQLTTNEEHEAGWRPGGAQFIAAHAASGRLFVVMNRLGEYAHKADGEEIWVFEAASGERIARFVTPAPVGRIAVSSDSDPLLVASGEGPPIHVMDPDDGRVLRTLEGPLLGAGILQFPEL
jgi:methylamine dehydrogenase heavy chain